MRLISIVGVFLSFLSMACARLTMNIVFSFAGDWLRMTVSIHLAIQIYMQMKFQFHIDCIQLFCSSISHANCKPSIVNHFNQVRHQTLKIAVTLDDYACAVSDQAWIGIVGGTCWLLEVAHSWCTCSQLQISLCTNNRIASYLWFVVFPE